MEKANSPGKGDTRQGEPEGQPLQPPADATGCHHPQGSNNERPSFREQLCHKRLLASLPRQAVSAESKSLYSSEIGEKLNRLCIVSGLYVDFAGVDVLGIGDGTADRVVPFSDYCFGLYRNGNYHHLIFDE